MTTIYQLFSQLIIFLTNLTGNLGFSIIIFTVFLRTLMYPLTLSSMKSAKRMQLIQPEIQKLQKKYKKNPEKLKQAQLELYQQEKINPLMGCLPQVIQIVLLIILYQAFIHFFKLVEEVSPGLNTTFLWLKLGEPDKTLVLPVLAGLSQFILSKLMMTNGADKKDSEEVESSKDKKKKVATKETHKDDEPGIMKSMQDMQKQMVYFFPIMTVMISLRLPSGLVLYWVISTLVSIVQQMQANKTIAVDEKTRSQSKNIIK